jgi:hypothetical protein
MDQTREGGNSVGDLQLRSSGEMHERESGEGAVRDSLGRIGIPVRSDRKTKMERNRVL